MNLLSLQSEVLQPNGDDKLKRWTEARISRLPPQDKGHWWLSYKHQSSSFVKSSVDILLFPLLLSPTRSIKIARYSFCLPFHNSVKNAASINAWKLKWLLQYYTLRNWFIHTHRSIGKYPSHPWRRRNRTSDRDEYSPASVWNDHSITLNSDLTRKMAPGLFLLRGGCSICQTRIGF